MPKLEEIIKFKELMGLIDLIKDLIEEKLSFEVN
jgi:hypothetical protein